MATPVFAVLFAGSSFPVPSTSFVQVGSICFSRMTIRQSPMESICVCAFLESSANIYGAEEQLLCPAPAPTGRADAVGIECHKRYHP